MPMKPQSRRLQAGKHAPARAQARPAKRKRALNTFGVKRSAKPEKAARPARPKKPFTVNRQNLKVLAWLWCFPVGLTKLWRSDCTWPRGVKIAITAVMAAIIVAVIVLPIPMGKVSSGGIQLVGVNPEVEVYGPELPVLIVPGYTNDQPQSVIVNEDEEANQVHYVYAAEGAECYHEYECKFAFASSSA